MLAPLATLFDSSLLTVANEAPKPASTSNADAETTLDRRFLPIGGMSAGVPMSSGNVDWRGKLARALLFKSLKDVREWFALRYASVLAST